ncbi:putative ATP-dependent RNA helicase TDRD12 isoform X2 [Rhinatrema bivittatum]|uniref:putative ATP-dependent RNA helicase TDRD12 isoform X2 n=1 Tax=Rhinatrema bivittatum TaxID=194408 RepID=UPI00112CC6E4|nr:putative ATP-dependent RNA helicase TDRD12 isoform X2 [Rhinatrema bivittatum]
MYEIVVLKVENPSCFWGTIVKGAGIVPDNTVEYEKLYDEMNWLYTCAFRDMEEIKPSSLEEGQIYMAYCQELKRWCRAIVESFISSADGYLAECFLVDHAKYVPVKTKSIRTLVETCLRLPFRAKKFKLSHIQPVTLCIDFYKDTAELGPAKRWDSAAIHYFQSLLKASTCIEAKVCSKEEDCYEVYLYATTQQETICINDELVTKNYARFVMLPETENVSSARTTTESNVENTQMASNSVTAQRDEIKNSVLALWPSLHGKVFKQLASEESISEMETESKFPVNKLHSEGQYNEKTDGAKLLQILNPDPLKAADDLNLEQFQKLNFNAQKHPIVLSKKIEPCSTLEQAPLSADLKKLLIQNEILGPNLTEAYCWPSVAQGYDSVVISPHGKDPMIYIPPILTYLQLASAAHKTVPSRNGPLVLFLCPGWKKAHHVFELLLLYGKCSRPLNPMLLLIGLDKEEAKNVKIPRGCEVIVTTPNSLLRLVEHQSLLFVRLCHIILDEVELLCSESSEQLLTILDLYKKNVIAEARKSTAQQIVAVGTRWHRLLELLIKEFMNDPHLVITTMEEAAMYGNVQQVVRLCLHCAKPSKLIRILDFTSTDAEKILIFTNSVEETEVIHKVVASNSVYCLKMHAKLHFHLNHVLEQWEKKCSSGTCVVLVLTDDCIPSLHITDATCVIHYDFPVSHQIFGLRLFTMSGNFQNKLQKGISVEPGSSKAKSILLLTEKNVWKAIGVLNYLEHTEAKIPQELYDFTLGILKAKEDRKLERPLCQYLKELGACRDIRTCPERHLINEQIDMAQTVSGKNIPTDGYISIIPLHIVNAANYYGRIIAKDDLYGSLATEMGDFYQKACNRVSVEKVEELALYGLHEGALYYRVQVLKVLQKEDCLFYSVNVSYIDEGRTGEIRGHQLLELPSRFQHLPPQAVEFIVARVKPIDNETSWNPKVTRHICQKIRGKQHDAKVTLSLGNTIWIDPMVKVTKLTDLKTSINEYNVRNEIISTGMGIDNPEHMEKLKALCREVQLADKSNTLQTSEHAVISDIMKVDPASDCVRNGVSETIPENNVCDNTNVSTESKKAVTVTESSLKSFHPQIKWFQKEDTLTLMIKLRNVTNHNSTFFMDRVKFSAHSEDKYYLADLELSNNILAKQSLCVIKKGEPVLILTKAKKGDWNSLLKKKNPNVCFDFEHLEDSEDVGRFPLVTSCGNNKYSVDIEDLESFLEESNSRGSDSESD